MPTTMISKNFKEDWDLVADGIENVSIYFTGSPKSRPIMEVYVGSTAPNDLSPRIEVYPEDRTFGFTGLVAGDKVYVRAKGTNRGDYVVLTR